MSPGLGVGVVGLGEYNPVAKSVFGKGGVEVSAVVVVVVEVVMVVVIEVAMVVTVDSCGLGFRTASLNVNAPEFVPKLWGVVGCFSGRGFAGGWPDAGGAVEGRGGGSPLGPLVRLGLCCCSL